MVKTANQFQPVKNRIALKDLRIIEAELFGEVLGRKVVIGFAEDGFRVRFGGVIQQKRPVDPAVNSVSILHPALDSLNAVEERQQGAARVRDNAERIHGSGAERAA
jgi:hypothetical protein